MPEGPHIISKAQCSDDAIKRVYFGTAENFPAIIRGTVLLPNFHFPSRVDRDPTPWGAFLRAVSDHYIM